MCLCVCVCVCIPTMINAGLEIVLVVFAVYWNQIQVTARASCVCLAFFFSSASRTIVYPGYVLNMLFWTFSVVAFENYRLQLLLF